jgi:hypothetical protein
MKLYTIKWHDNNGDLTLVAITDNINKWLNANNKRRLADGEIPESINDFVVKEVEAIIYNGGSNAR